MEELATTYGLELSFSQTQQSDVFVEVKAETFLVDNISGAIGADILSSYELSSLVACCSSTPSIESRHMNTLEMLIRLKMNSYALLPNLPNLFLQ
jgi:hypothetical protein